MWPPPDPIHAPWRLLSVSPCGLVVLRRWCPHDPSVCDPLRLAFALSIRPLRADQTGPFCVAGPHCAPPVPCWEALGLRVRCLYTRLFRWGKCPGAVARCGVGFPRELPHRFPEGLCLAQSHGDGDGRVAPPQPASLPAAVGAPVLRGRPYGSAPRAPVPWGGRSGLLISFARFLIGWNAFLLWCFESSSYSLAESFAGHPVCLRLGFQSSQRGLPQSRLLI